MAKLSDVVDLAKSNKYVSIWVVQQSLGISEEQACKALLLCWEKGLLLPTTASWFLPPENGRPVNVRTSSSGTSARDSYFKSGGDKVVKFLEENEGKGYSVRELMAELDMPDAQLRKILSMLGEQQRIYITEASAGGSYGRKPKIYSASEEGLYARDAQFIAADELKKQERRKQKQQAQKAITGGNPFVDTTFDPETGEIY